MREIDLAVSSEAIKEVQKRLLVEFGGCVEGVEEQR